jgi:hypothetical protein
MKKFLKILNDIADYALMLIYTIIFIYGVVSILKDMGVI